MTSISFLINEGFNIGLYFLNVFFGIKMVF